jgi:hypothetical protein
MDPRPGGETTPVSPPEPKPWAQIAAFVRDLDGITVELCTPSRPPEHAARQAAGKTP